MSNSNGDQILYQIALNEWKKDENLHKRIIPYRILGRNQNADINIFAQVLDTIEDIGRTDPEWFVSIYATKVNEIEKAEEQLHYLKLLCQKFEDSYKTAYVNKELSGIQDVIDTFLSTLDKKTRQMIFNDIIQNRNLFESLSIELQIYLQEAIANDIGAAESTRKLAIYVSSNSYV